MKRAYALEGHGYMSGWKAPLASTSRIQIIHFGGLSQWPLWCNKDVISVVPVCYVFFFSHPQRTWHFAINLGNKDKHTQHSLSLSQIWWKLLWGQPQPLQGKGCELGEVSDATLLCSGPSLCISTSACTRQLYPTRLSQLEVAHQIWWLPGSVFGRPLVAC